MASTMVNFRLDSDVKANMEKACKEMGLSMTAAFTIFATKVARERRIPFEVTAETPNETTINAMKNVLDSKEMSRSFGSVKELTEDLNADN